MKKLFCILVVALVAGACIFYACNKDGKEIIPENLTKEAGKFVLKEADFIAKNYEETCVHVQIFRDEDNNAHFVTKMVDNDPKEPVSLRIPETLKLESQQSKEDGHYFIEIPNDGIYWLVAFDGHEPVKFEPIDKGNAKAMSFNSISDYYCTCEVCTDGYFNKRDCEVKCVSQNNVYVYSCEFTSREGHINECKKCVLHKYAKYNSGGVSHSAVFIGSAYLVKSDIITINGVVYKDSFINKEN